MSKKPRSRINLHEILRKGSFDHAVLCTYTFSPTFFEEYCLEKFDSLGGTPNITVLTDQSIYSEFLAGHPSERPKQANVRYLVHPVRVPGRFHPKLYLFVSTKKGRLVIGSANFTRAGITTNAELVSVFDYDEEDNAETRAMFAAAYRFLTRIAGDSQSRSLESNIKAIARDAPWIVDDREESEMPNEGAIQLLHNLEEPLWDQIVQVLDPPIDSFNVLSLFFDKEPRLLDRIIDDLAPNSITLYTENGRTTLTKQWLDHPAFRDGRLKVSLVSYKDDDFVQPLHAKALYLQSATTATLVQGSANFTTPALLRSASNGNTETLLVVTGLDSSCYRLDTVFDPCNTAHNLPGPDQLETASRDSADQDEGHLLVLREAEFIDDHLRITAAIPETVRWERLEGKIQFTSAATAVVSLIGSVEGEYQAQLKPEVRQRLDQGSTTLKITAYGISEQLATSNTVLITNLVEFRTGQSLRRARHIREAQENVDQFFRVLNELLTGSDESALLVFFNLCDIPILEATRPGVFRRERPQWDGGESMRSLGKRNLVVYRQLHDAAIAFFDRHYRKLRRHVEYGSLKGASNYLHIFFAMGGVLRAQVERLIQGLEAQEGPIDIQSWAAIRSHLDDYYRRFKELSTSLYEGYVPKLSHEYGWEAVREQFANELSNLRELRENMLAFRERLEALRTGVLRVRTPSGGGVTLKYFTCVFDEANWTRFTSEVEGLARVELRLTA